MRRQSGLGVPLFSLATARGWGIGEFPDLAVFARWAAEAGQAVLQILPVIEMPPGERSPYSALTAMALDPIYIAMSDVPDFEGLGGELALDAVDVAALAAVRQSPRIRYEEVRDLKQRCLRRAFDRFLRLEVARGTPRAAHFDRFVATEAWWLDEYALFRALKAHYDEQPWSRWPGAVARAEPASVQEAKETLHGEITYRKYLQWIAGEQWRDAKRLAWPVRILGDLPFMISDDSPDVWARQQEFRFDATIGVPPDEFSVTGQDWGLPPWRWEVMASTGFAWMHARARRSSDLFDGFRIDHLIGLYRMFIRPTDKGRRPFFEPSDETDQIRLGEELVTILRRDREPGLGTPLEVIAEDLGVIPPFLHESMARLNLPGMKVLRWQRDWAHPDQPALDPTGFPELSVATTGTHDVEPLAATAGGRTEEQRAAVLQSLLSAKSYLTLIPVQDVFGWPDRINTPSVVDAFNWTWRLPWPVDTWLHRKDTVARAAALRAWTRAADR